MDNDENKDGFAVDCNIQGRDLAFPAIGREELKRNDILIIWGISM